MPINVFEPARRCISREDVMRKKLTNFDMFGNNFSLRPLSDGSFLENGLAFSEGSAD